MREIKFKNKNFILIGENEGPITTRHHFKHGLCSYAHLFKDGKVKRFNKEIGTAKDIKLGKEIKDILLANDAIGNMLGGWLLDRINKGE